LREDDISGSIPPRIKIRGILETVMSEAKKPKRYDLEERTFKFANDVRSFVKLLPKSTANTEDIKQVVRSSGSVGANYIEANEAVSKKDFLLRIKISRKEAKESKFWLDLLDTGGDERLERLREKLVQEAVELMKIFSSIMRSSNS